MNILIACDSFKDALDAASVCKAVARGLKTANASFNTRVFPLADGGEGMSEVLDFHLGLQKVQVEVQNPVFKPITATYNLSADGQIAFIEMAQAAGLQLLPAQERNPLQTSTFGVGEMIKNAAGRGVQRVVLGLGGSATNDLGIGMAAALGWQFLDENGAELSPVGGNLGKIARIEAPAEPPFPDIRFEVMCDVTNPLLGPQGAAAVYARQKGASDESIQILESGAAQVVELAARTHPQAAAQAGAGAAGGLGFGALFFLNATIKRGIDAIMDLTNFAQQAAWADVVFTGEGRLDSQTAHGKLIAGVIARAQGKRVIALCGAVEASPEDLKKLGLQAAFSIAQKPCTLPEALAATAANLEQTAFQVGRLL